jgi:dienelactone hydrolase
VEANDERLVIERMTFLGATGDVATYTARPKGEVKHAAVIVIHENRGLNAHIEDVARRLALEGFWAVAPDLLSPLGGTPADPDSARAGIGKLDRLATVGNVVAAVGFLSKHHQGNGKVGAVGFCWGGAMVGELAVQAADLDAAVVYYGSATRREAVGASAPLLLHYAGTDERVNAGIPAEAALKKAESTPCTSTRRAAPTTTPPKHATTRRPPTSPGHAPSPSCANTSRPEVLAACSGSDNSAAVTTRTPRAAAATLRRSTNNIMPSGIMPCGRMLQGRGLGGGLFTHRRLLAQAPEVLRFSRLSQLPDDHQLLRLDEVGGRDSVEIDARSDLVPVLVASQTTAWSPTACRPSTSI